MPYIAMIRDDIPDGVLQVLDLFPNTSLRNQVVDPPGQTKYVRRLQNDSVSVSSSVTTAEFKGLAAYLIDAVADGGDGGALTAAEANAMAAGIIANVLDAGVAATLANINVELAAVVAGTALTAGGSVGTLADVLKILAGGEYVVPAGTAADSGAGLFKGALAGAFTSGQYRGTYDSFALNISVAEGSLSHYASASFEYGGTPGAAVVVYDDTGALLT